MRKPSSRIVLTDSIQELISLSRNMKREDGTLRFATTEGDKKILSLEDVFSTRELTLRCLKTTSAPPMKYHCKFDRAYDLGPLVQYFSWNDRANAVMYLGDVDFSEQKKQLNIFNTLEKIPEKLYFSVSENGKVDSISLFVELENVIIGTIIDFTKNSDGIQPFKIFGMNVPRDKGNIDIFYTSPQEGHECFDLAVSLIEKYSVKSRER